MDVCTINNLNYFHYHNDYDCTRISTIILAEVVRPLIAHLYGVFKELKGKKRRKIQRGKARRTNWPTMLFESLPEGGWTHIRETRVEESEMVRLSGDRYILFWQRQGHSLRLTPEQ